MCTLAVAGTDNWNLVATDLAFYVADDEGEIVRTVTQRDALMPTANGWLAWTGDYWTGRGVAKRLTNSDATDLDRNKRLLRESRREAADRHDSDSEQMDLTKVAVATAEGAAIFDGVRSKVIGGQTWVSPPPLEDDFKRQIGRQLKAGICPDLERTCAAFAGFFLRIHGRSAGTSDQFAIGVARPSGETERFDFSIPQIRERLQ